MTRSGNRQVFTAFLALFLGCKQTDGSNVQPPATPSPATAGNPVAPATTPNGAAGTLPGASLQRLEHQLDRAREHLLL